MPISTTSRPKKYFSRYQPPLTEMPHLVESQLVSFASLLDHGFSNLLKEFSPIKDYAEKKFELSISDPELVRPKFDEHYAKNNKLNFEGQVKVKVTLKNKSLNVVKEQEMFLADFPLMTDHGSFIINGVERVIVPQLARSFGIFFTSTEVKGKNYFGAKVIPARGVWMEIEADADSTIYCRIDRKRKFPVTSLLRILGADTNEKIKAAFEGNPEALKVIETSTSVFVMGTLLQQKTHATLSRDSLVQNVTISHVLVVSALTSVSRSLWMKRLSNAALFLSTTWPQPLPML